MCAIRSRMLGLLESAETLLALSAPLSRTPTAASYSPRSTCSLPNACRHRTSSAGSPDSAVYRSAALTARCRSSKPWLVAPTDRFRARARSAFASSSASLALVAAATARPRNSARDNPSTLSPGIGAAARFANCAAFLKAPARSAN